MTLQNTEKTVLLLNSLLATYQVYYQNLRGFHWNIQGPRFFDLHQKFEELYTEAAVSIDDIAERILALDGVPFHSFQKFIEHSKIAAATDVHDPEGSVNAIVENLTTIIDLEQEIMKVAADDEDEGTTTLISDMIKTEEKTRWMFKAYLK